MGQSKFKWIIVFDDGDKDVFEGTFDELMSKISEWFSSVPVAIIRGAMLWRNAIEEGKDETGETD